MRTGNKTYPPKGKVTLESSMRIPTEESRMMRMLDGSLVEFRGRLSEINSRQTNVEDEIWAKETGFTLPCEFRGRLSEINSRQTNVEDEIWAKEIGFTLPSYVPIVSLPCIDNVLVGSVDTLGDPIDDRVDSFSKIDLCPPSVDTCTLNASTLSCDNCDDQPACECGSLVEGPCNVIKEPQVSGANDNVDLLNRSDSMSLSFAEDPIACLVHTDHVLEHTSNNDICPFEGELACFDSSLVVDRLLLKYNVLFEDDGITPSDVPSGGKLESSVVLNNYNVYSNPLRCEAFPPKDENLFLEDESTLVGKECDEEEGGVGFPITSSSWCVSILDSMTNAFEPIGSHTHENTLEEVNLRDTFVYYLFTHDEAHVVEWSMMLENESASRAKGEVLGVHGSPFHLTPVVN
uniref:Uncharacterized protein n=1 Tax=Solanum tuberosum TaxID=4113 RepID=M1D8F8_SOLTU